MKRQIRNNVFETNSSSTHSLTICSEEQFEDWKNGKLLFNDWDDEFVKFNELTDQDKQDAKNEYERKKQIYWKDWEQLTDDEVNKWYEKYAKENKFSSHNDCKTFDDWKYSTDLEYFVEHHTTPGGEKIVAFGHYGYDG